MIKVAFTSIFYPVFMGRYILEAFLRRSDCEVWTAGPYTGRWIPWAGGMNLPETYLHTPNLPLAAGTPSQIAYPILENKCPFEPDLWIEVNSTLKVIKRPTTGKYIIVGTDPHVLDYTAERNRADTFYCMQRPYMKPGDLWLPYAYDPIWHAQTTIPAAERSHDAALLGLPYTERNELVARLRSKGLKVFYELGPSYNDARDIYHNTRVGLNWSSLLDTTARVFELMAFGICPVLNRVPDLMEMFVENEHFLGFANLEEGANKAESAAKDPEMCDAMGAKAREAVRPHTWDARAKQILEDAGFVSDVQIEDAG